MNYWDNDDDKPNTLENIVNRIGYIELDNLDAHSTLDLFNIPRADKITGKSLTLSQRILFSKGLDIDFINCLILMIKNGFLKDSNDTTNTDEQN